MGAFADAFAPKLAKAFWVMFCIGVLVGIYYFIPDPVKVWAFELIDKYLPFISDWFK